MAWSVRIDEPVTHLLVGMDDKTMTDFVTAMVNLGTDPYRGSAHGTEQWALPLGGLGFVVYMLFEDEHAVMIIDVVWIG